MLPAKVTEPSRAAGPPSREAGKDVLVPEEGKEEDGSTGDTRGGGLESESRWEEVREGPQEHERDDKVRKHGGETARPPLDDAQYAHLGRRRGRRRSRNPSWE